MISRVEGGKIRAIVISSVQPNPTTAGEVKLYRHLVENHEIELVLQPVEALMSVQANFTQRVLTRLEHTRFSRWVADGKMLQSARCLDRYLPAPPQNGLKALVITVAHGNVCWAAQRYAQKYGLPLITWFDDWWPDLDLIHAPLRQILERRFRKLYQQSQLALCVSKGMQALLGRHPNAPVLYPIPAKLGTLTPSQKQHVDFRVFYFGNLYDYGPMVAEALNALRGQSQIRLEVRGGNPQWPNDFREEMAREGCWHGFAPRGELEAWLVSASAFLVPMVFEPQMRRRMETSFPSKMLEMAQLGKPLVIWGPEYCSAVQWARLGNRALCVTDPNPAALRQALEKLAVTPVEQQRLAAAARQAAQTDFNPDNIQVQFMQALRRVAQITN